MTADQQDPRAIADRLAARAGEWYGTDLADDLNAAIVALRSRPTSPTPEHARAEMKQAMYRALMTSGRYLGARPVVVDAEAERMTEVALAASPVPAVPDREAVLTEVRRRMYAVAASWRVSPPTPADATRSRERVATEELWRQVAEDIEAWADAPDHLVPDLPSRITSTTGEEP